MSKKPTPVAAAVLALLLVVSSSLFAGTLGYQYAALHRLTRATYPNGAQIQYSYDPAGNRTEMIATAALDTDVDGIPGVGDNCPYEPMAIRPMPTVCSTVSTTACSMPTPARKTTTATA
ncbi:MAG: RHS repeat protein [Chromatiaceae bacterium]|nr:RHS repeat protein [Chromatiaceae bacterium]